MDPKLRALLKQGERATRLGKTQAAEDVYRQAVALFPDSADAWMGLSQVAPSEGERTACRRRAVELDPAVAVPSEAFATPSSSDPPSVPVPAMETPSSQLDAVLADSQNRLRQATLGTSVAKVKEPSPRSAPEVEPDAVAAPAAEMTTCFYHPSVETTLRCNRCSKPICTRCAVSTPVGYRCKECIREQQETFYSTLWYDYVLAAVVTIPLAAVASLIISGIGWLTIFVAPFVGGIIAEAVRLVTGRRRGRWLPLVVSLAMIAGALPILAGGMIGFLIGPLRLGNTIWQVVYLALAISSAYYRTK
jgi:hypothetical protein